MVLSTKIDSVDIHASIIGPVVCESHNELDAGLARGIDNFVESRDINRRLAILPALENDWSASSTFTAVLWKSSRIICDVLVIETPRSEDIQTSLLRGG